MPLSSVMDFKESMLMKDDRLDGKNYDIWHKKIQYLLKEKDELEAITNVMVPPQEGNTAQNQCDQATFDSWLKKDRSARYTILACMHDDLMKEFEKYPTAKEMWDDLKIRFGSTKATRLHVLTLKFNQYMMDPQHCMSRHLQKMSEMIKELKEAGSNISDEQQVLQVLKSLPEQSWGKVKLVLLHDENIKNFDDLCRHLEFEALLKEANCSDAFIPQTNQQQIF